MLPLTDPLWQKLDAATDDEDVPGLLRALSQAWDKAKAGLLLTQVLHDRDTGPCYGSTYAAVPHLLALAEPDGNHAQRRGIALLLGFLALMALESGAEAPLPGLPEDLDAWERKRDIYRLCVAAYEDPSRPVNAREQANLPRCKEILAIPPVDAADLERIKAIKAGFLAALPRISALNERALLDSIAAGPPPTPPNPPSPRVERVEADDIDEDYIEEDYFEEEDIDETTRHLLLLSGIAAAEGLPALALLLNAGDKGWLRCAACSTRFSYTPRGGRIALYAEPPPETPCGYEPQSLDFMEETSARADGFIAPAGRDDISDPRLQRLLDLADRSPYPEPGLLLRNFLGRIVCRKCGKLAPIRGGAPF